MKTTIICIETLCGRIAPAGFGSGKDRSFLEKIRAETDATLLGAGSLRAGDPECKISGDLIPDSRIRALITSSGKIPQNRSMFSKGRAPLIFSPVKMQTRLQENFGHRAEVVGTDETSPGILSLKAVMNVLEQRGAETCLIEGGGGLNYEALRQQVADELLVTIAPKVTGKMDEPCLISGSQTLGSPFVELKLLSCRPDGETGEIFLRYRVIRR